MCSTAGLPHCTIRGLRVMAALSQGLLQGCEAGCAARGAEGCPSEQGPCTPGGCVPGQGLCRLPGSALSLPGELPMTPWGEAVGGRSHSLQGRVLVSRGRSVGQGCSQLQIPTGDSQETFQEAQQGRGYLKGKDPVLSIFYSGMSGWAMGHRNSSLSSGGGTETPNLLLLEVNKPGSIRNQHTVAYRQHQYPFSSLIRVGLMFPSEPAHTDAPGQCPAAGRGLQGRAEHTAGGMGSVSSDREETQGQRNNSW